MGLRKFEHIAAKTFDEAVAYAGKYRASAALVAGGTDLFGALKDEIHPVYPQVLIDLKTIKGLDGIKEEAGGVTIGTLATLTQITTHPLIKSKFPMLSEAAHAVASPQLRNMGTIGGNICQEPRCWYYRNPDNTFHCLRKGGDGCPALNGENRFHSIFGSMRVGSPGCNSGCPDNIDIPRYMERIRAGEIAEAGWIILEHNPMPAVTGRVCPHFCEQGCNRVEKDSAVSIRAVERRIGDYVLENIKIYTKAPARDNGKNVAVVGGGPAGLTAAYFLKQNGFAVTIYDKQPKLGGMLRYGIPDFRLSQGVLDKEIAFLLSNGIIAKSGQTLGKDFTLDGLKKDGFDAVFLAMGSWVAKGMGIDNEKHANIVPGISFLEGVKWNGPPALKGTVAVVGGGNTAIDAARTALRCGASKVVLLYRRTRDEMPAEDEEIEDAIKEGVELQFLVAPKKAMVEGSKLAGLECARMKLGEPDASGRPRPVEIQGSEFVFKADWVISAIGQDQNLLGLDNKSFGKIGISRNNGIQADSETFQTTVPGVFAGGDVVTGPATVVEAIAAGRKAAKAIEDFLSDRTAHTGVKAAARPDAVPEKLRPINNSSLKESERVNVVELAPSNHCFDVEDYETIDDGKLGTEAHRCFDCSCVAVNASDVAPALVALGASIRTNRRTIEAEDFFTVRIKDTTVLGVDELVREIHVPLLKTGTRNSFHKFRIRNSIDFPIVSVAAALRMEGTKFKEARMVFGAVAPVPLRAMSVEEFLVGKEANEETAAQAGEIAVRQVYPLSNNRYKAQILKGMIRKAILGQK
jgi:NADPH-dependent glutamate synthase beta subunit-like oxidoreductase/CO/xanthine dehydrogenase FAD-binding subunit